jgi:uncharacterized protein
MFMRKDWFMQSKLEALRDLFRQMESVAVAYSGGVDSAFLLKVAHDTLGDAVVALTADSASLPRSELADATALAARLGVKHVCLPISETSDVRYLSNSPDRCYFCKTYTYDELITYARQKGYRSIVDGNNADDLGDYRPGRKAAREHGVRSPLQEVGLTKAEIRELSRALGLPTWDKPAAACLSSRIPYGTVITLEALAQVEQSEAYLHEKGFREVRVRHHGAIARLELAPADFERALAAREEIVSALRGIGFTYVALDLAGFRSGSMNEALRAHGRKQAQ